MLLLLTGCATPQKQDRAAAAKALFEQSVTLHQQHEFSGAATGYERLLMAYRDQPYWCAQALRSLGNVRAAQGKLDEAVKLYRRVGEQYPQQDWEVLQAWKSAADLLWVRWGRVTKSTMPKITITAKISSMVMAREEEDV